MVRSAILPLFFMGSVIKKTHSLLGHWLLFAWFATMSGAKDPSLEKGANMTMLEDVEMAKAFVAASKDRIVGSQQKSSDFKAKIGLVNLLTVQSRGLL